MREIDRSTNGSNIVREVNIVKGDIFDIVQVQSTTRKRRTTESDEVEVSEGNWLLFAGGIN